MNFFEHQDSARKKTSLLVALLLAAVACLIAITVIAVGSFLYFVSSNSTSIGAYQAQQRSLFEHMLTLVQSPLAGWIALVVTLVVLAGSLYKLLSLSRGGRSVAESLGGKAIDPDSREPNQRKILNVVEEMAIASGNPVPPVYLLEDNAINAFAAGLSRRDAVIGVTRGCIEQLNRDELQGVIAHEFSHVHNGDMRLNIRLVAVLHGILLIGLIGYYLLRGSSAGYRSRRDSRQLAFGMILVAVGYGGTFFGNLIKAAVSRQREFLADASAVQFTRNPQGIAGALKKIAGYADGSLLHNGKASEFSHLYFSQGIKTAFAGWMATHPPLDERIKRIDAKWLARPSKRQSESVPQDTSDGVAHFAPPLGALEDAVDIIGEPVPENLAQADGLIGGLPERLHKAAHQAFSARALIYGLLLDPDMAAREVQLNFLQQHAHPVTQRELGHLLPDILPLDRRQRHTLVQLCIPALKLQSAKQYQVFKNNLGALIRSDKKVTLFEWCLHRSIVKSVEISEQKEHLRIGQVSDDITLLLRTLLATGRHQHREKVLEQALNQLDLKLSDMKASKISLSALGRAMDRVEALKALEKPKLLKALIFAIKADGHVDIEEMELFRAIADSLNCPVPPIA